jgi:hypothetical protein
MGYDDVRSLQSTLNLHSPGESPTISHNGGFWTSERSIEREELTAARLKSQLQTSTPAIISYGPNPVTPTPKTQIHSSPPDADPPLPKKPAVPIVVSYGPNKVTPTPLVKSPTVPPDEAILNRRYMEMDAMDASVPAPPITHERQFSWVPDSPLLGASSMGPLPPYASTADFEAMEKGAVRKLAEPQADAELPPTKDGFYHYTSDTVEYELPGAAPQNEPQLPFRPYKVQAPAGPSASWHREIDEQKFLLSDEEIMKMRAEKAKIRAAAAAEAARAGADESYDLGEPVSRR